MTDAVRMSLSNFPRPWLAAAVLTAGALGSTGRAMADGPLAWSVVIEVSCGSRGPELAREVVLACDAVGHACRVATGARAERRAVVTCPSEERWTLEAQTETGAPLWAVALDGAREGRLRTAAMWIARAQRDAPPPDAPVIAGAVAPTPPLARTPEAAALPAGSFSPASASPPPVTPPPSPVLVEPARQEPARPPVTSERDAGSSSRPSSSQRGGLALAARGSVSGGLAPTTLGASARAVLGLPARANVGLVLAADHALGDTSGYALTTARAGAALGWGAPWSEEDALGASLEVGPVFGVVSAPSDVAPGSRGFVNAYAQLSVFGRARGMGSFRPWIALAVAALAAPVNVSEGAAAVASQPSVSGVMDVGVAWAGW